MQWPSMIFHLPGERASSRHRTSHRLFSYRRRIMRTPAVWLPVFTFGLVSFVSPRGPPKPMEQWTQKEAENLLIDSPWAQTLGGGVAADQQTLTGTTVTIRLRSALPIRQALARLRQLKSKYDK